MAEKDNRAGSFRKKLAEEKISSLNEILALTGVQQQLIEKEEIDDLLDNIAQRQKFIDYIEELDKKDAEIISKHGNDITYDEHGAYIEKMRALLADISKQDKANMSKAEARLEEYAKEIKNINQNKKGVDGYTKGFQYEGVYFDKNK